ncbi:hypothetical protein [Streptomyces rochei]|uniref:hypothetical protein n=1 Tax=Streptomyces rochei TaxID=1928 RepID=UPI000782E552|nr:hypothetical protein AUW26_20915 [Streptomyces sp. CC71]QCR49540.1 hypothetical protein C1N79_24635 [Streptomyces sp. SGAir0924]
MQDSDVQFTDFGLVTSARYASQFAQGRRSTSVNERMRSEHRTSFGRGRGGATVNIRKATLKRNHFHG